MENINENIAINITKLRKANNLTQAELAKKLNYSDKAISKWERGDSIPDINMLYNVAKLFNVDIEYLITEHSNRDIQKTKQSKQLFIRDLLITLLLCVSVFCIATFIFVYLIISKKDSNNSSWLLFIGAVPICSIIVTLYGKRSKYWLVELISLSLFIWTLITTIFCIKIVFNPSELFWLIYLLGIPIQAAICLFFFMKKTY